MGMYLNVVFFALSIADVKKVVSIKKKNKFDLQKAMKVNFKVIIKVTIECRSHSPTSSKDNVVIFD